MEGVPLDVECLFEMDASHQQGTNKTVGAVPYVTVPRLQTVMLT